MKSDLQWLRQAAEVAKENSGCAGAKVGAVLVIKNRLISIGKNRLQSHPLMMRHADREEVIFLHAEVSAIIRAGKMVNIDSDLKDATLYVARVKHPPNRRHEFMWGLAKPCEKVCVPVLAAYGLGRVVYSLNSETEEFEVM